MTVKLNPATPNVADKVPEPQVADEQVTLDVQASAKQQATEEQVTLDVQASAKQQATEEQVNVTVTEETQVTEQEPGIETPKAPVDVSDIAPFTGRERVPSDWLIRQEDGELVFSNNVTARRIVGITVEQFNVLLKG